MIFFNDGGRAYQKFDALPKTIMDYSLKNLKPQHLVKLYETAKYFYYNFPLKIIQSVTIENHQTEKFSFRETVVDIDNFSKLKDFLIFDSFYCRDFLDRYSLTSFTNLKIRKLELLEDIYFVDYKHLTKTETIQEVKIAGVYDRREFYYLSIEKIIAEVPTATSIETRVSVFKENSLNLLIALNRKVKIYNFVIKGIYGTFYVKADLLVDFFSKHGADNCNILLDLKLWPDQYNPYESNKTRTYDYTKRIAEVIAKKKETTIRNF